MMKKNEEEIEVKKEGWFEPEGELVVDVWENEEEIVIQAPVAGVENDDIEIIIEGDVLKIKGERPNTTEVKEENYLLKECYWGSFGREISLPESIKKEDVKASVEKGILTIKLPKKEQEQEGKKIEIE